MASIDPRVFAEKGCIGLEGFHPKARMASIRQSLLDGLKRAHVGKGIPPAIRSLPMFQQIARLSALVQVPGLHASLVTPELKEAITALGGQAPVSIQETQLLLSPRAQGNWSLQGLNWHVDVTAAARGPIPGIQAFFLIDDVAPRGGATLALAGSHRPGVDIPALRRLLKASTHLERDLQSLGIELIEMCGRAGDVFLMDMRVLHTPSINATRELRMMATARCFLQT
ncbi:phytanoyl-CoA dioxygenase family protein [Pseudoxanthomonas suwonensis]|uniref:phytanoyl-CoA dioxygenase family protein n=1 Tax=Pseudoxanthomonas suwonensis TaxID=314722 RepID=UPI00048B86B3|nr:phytanoyl-CoA dioxygenase family protein [Pseudoxanthomonas suwonensis]